MPIRAETKDGVSLLYIDGEMTIYTAAELKAQLLPHLTHSSEIQIDASQVSEIDCAGLQLLILAKRETSRVGANLHLTQHSGATREILDQCNLTAYFGSPLESSQLTSSRTSSRTST